MIVLEMKCPQLSKPEATAARNENSICDRMEKKPWEKPGSVGGPVPLRPDESVVCSKCSKVRVSLCQSDTKTQSQSVRVTKVHWFQGSFPDGCLGDEVLTGDLSHLCVLDSADGQGCIGFLQVLILHLWQTLVKSV